MWKFDRNGVLAGIALSWELAGDLKNCRSPDSSMDTFQRIKNAGECTARCMGIRLAAKINGHNSMEMPRRQAIEGTLKFAGNSSGLLKRFISQLPEWHFRQTEYGF